MATATRPARAKSEEEDDLISQFMKLGQPMSIYTQSSDPSADTTGSDVNKSAAMDDSSDADGVQTTDVNKNGSMDGIQRDDPSDGIRGGASMNRIDAANHAKMPTGEIQPDYRGAAASASSFHGGIAAGSAFATADDEDMMFDDDPPDLHVSSTGDLFFEETDDDVSTPTNPEPITEMNQDVALESGLAGNIKTRVDQLSARVSKVEKSVAEAMPKRVTFGPTEFASSAGPAKSAPFGRMWVSDEKLTDDERSAIDAAVDDLL